MAPPKKSGTVESETVSSRSSRTETSSSSKRSSKSPAKTARGSMARSRSQSGSRAAPSGRSPGRPRSPKKEHTPRKASRSPAKKTAAKSPARKSPAKKSPARKSPAARSPARKSPARPVGRPRSPAKPKSPARKSPGRKSPAPKSPGRKSVASKSPAKKTPAKMARASSKSPARTTQRKKSVSPAREKKELSPKAVAQSPAPLLSSSGSSSSEGGSEVRRRSTLLSTISSLGALPTVNLGNSLIRRTTAATTSSMLSESKAQASYSSPPPPSLPQRSSQRIATMQASLEEEHGGMGGPSTSRQHLEPKGVYVPPPSSSRLGRLRQLLRVPPGLWASAKALCWLAFLPATVLLLYLLCRKEQCTVLQAPRIPWELSSYFHWKLYAGYGGFLLLQALVQALPLGRRVQGFPSKALKHRIAYDYGLNGWANLLVTVGAFGALTYYGFPMTIPYRYSLQLLVTTLVFALVLSLVLFVKGRWAPWEHIYPLGNSGNWLNDFVEGRELSPRIGKRFDLASLFFRCGLLTWVVLLGSMAWHEYNTRGCFDHSFVLSAACQFLYVCMIFFDEEYFLGSAFVTEEGLGFASVVGRLVLLPFLGALPPKFLLEHRPPTLRLYCLASIGIVFLIGLVSMHLAHKRKYLFRRNWPDPTSRGLGMDYLADGAGNRLMMSGLWGFVRHPNYLADLLCQLAFALPCGIHHVLPYYSVLLSTVFLVARTVAVERKCQDRYGDLWTRYTEQVKYRLVPFVF